MTSAVNPPAVGISAAEPLSARQHPAAVRQLSIPSLLGASLLPGALGVAVYVSLEHLVASTGYPPIAALLVAVLVVIMPVEIATLLIVRRGADARREPLLPYREHLTWRSAAWLVPVLLLAAVAGSLILTPVDNVVLHLVFRGLPGWFQVPLDASAADAYPRSTWIITLTAYMLLNGIVAPIVEELYFRGWLLPRMERFGRWAPLVNAGLFSLYHFWLPWGFLSRVAAVGPYIYAVRWRRNIYLGIAVHILLNTVGGLLVVAQIAGGLTAAPGR